MIFDYVATISLGSRESLKEKKNNFPEAVPPLKPLDQSSLDQCFRPSLDPESKGGKKREQRLLKSYSNHFIFLNSWCFLYCDI